MLSFSEQAAAWVAVRVTHLLAASPSCCPLPCAPVPFEADHLMGLQQRAVTAANRVSEAQTHLLDFQDEGGRYCAGATSGLGDPRQLQLLACSPLVGIAHAYQRIFKAFAQIDIPLLCAKTKNERNLTRLFWVGI